MKKGLGEAVLPHPMLSDAYPAPRARNTVDTAREVVPQFEASLSNVEPIAVNTIPHTPIANLYRK